MSVVNRIAVYIALVAGAAGGAGIASLSAQEDAPARKVTSRVQPVYPAIAQRAHMVGAVKLVLVVTPEGTVKTVRALGGNPVLIEAAEDAVKRWKYERAKTESSEAVTVNFQSPG